MGRAGRVTGLTGVLCGTAAGALAVLAAQTREAATPLPGRAIRYCNPLAIEASSRDGSPQGVHLGDVTVVREGGRYYLFGTGGGGWVSEDLVNWRYEGVEMRHGRVPVAPHVVRYGGQFYMSGNDAPLYRAPAILGPYEVVGDWTDVSGKPFAGVANGRGWVGAFDVDIFVDEDGKPYLYFPARSTEGIDVVPLDPRHLNRFLAAPKRLFGFDRSHVWERYGEMNEYPDVSWVEGPWMLKHEGTYYLQYSASGTQWLTYATGMYTGKSATGPFTYAPVNPVLRKTSGVVTGTAHGSIVEGPDGNLWQFYTIVLSNPPGGRRIGMDPVGFDAQGNLFVRGPSETPQWGPGAVADPARHGDSGSLPLTVGKMRAMNTRSTFSSQRQGRDAAYAVDNSTGTWWEPAEDDPQPSITVDLGPATEFDPVQLFSVDSSRILFAAARGRPGATAATTPRATTVEGAVAHRYRIDVSSDGKAFTTLLDKTRNTVTKYVEFDELPPTTCRFVRLTLTGWPHNPATPLGILEFTVFGKAVSPSAPPDPELRRAAPEARAEAGRTPAGADFLGWAVKPPMGWNSWDAFGTTLTEAQARAQADFMAAQLLPHGWRILTVDIQWYEPGASGHSYRANAPLSMDEWGRLLPAANRFPSAAGGAGFRPLADYVHAKGLQLGIHLMRGVPRLAVARKLPVKGTSVTAADVADTASVCPWNPDMFGVDMAKPGAQAYYDSVFELIASWGVDFVKVDDISRPYHEHQREIEAIRRAIDRTGRPIVLSLSPGETALSAADHVKRHANMWRISDDFWDTWPALLEQFDRLARWNPHRGPGHWPDADMLPLGVLDFGRRSTRFTPDEQRTVLTLWSIARSPLVHGGDMTKTDPDTLRLLTNDEVIAVNQHSEGNRPLFDRDGLVAWTANAPSSPDRYLALFNARDRFPLDLRTPAFASPLVTRATPGHGVEVDVDVHGRVRLVLVAEGGEDGSGWDHALWTEPRLVMSDGTERRLTDERWVQATAGWGEVSTERSPSGGPMRVDGRTVRYGIAAHARSLVEYSLPPSASRFRAFAAVDDGALTQPTGATVRFYVHALPPAEPADPAGAPIGVSLAELSLSGPCRVRDLWTHEGLPSVERELVAVVPWHGAVLYRLSPAREP